MAAALLGGEQVPGAEPPAAGDAAAGPAAAGLPVQAAGEAQAGAAPWQRLVVPAVAAQQAKPAAAVAESQQALLVWGVEAQRVLPASQPAAAAQRAPVRAAAGVALQVAAQPAEGAAAPAATAGIRPAAPPPAVGWAVLPAPLPQVQRLAAVGRAGQSACGAAPLAQGGQLYWGDFEVNHVAAWRCWHCRHSCCWRLPLLLLGLPDQRVDGAQLLPAAIWPALDCHQRAHWDVLQAKLLHESLCKTGGFSIRRMA